MRAIVVTIVLFLLSGLGAASPIPGKWEKVQRLQPGTMITVVMSHGDRIEGAFRELSSSSLRIAAANGQSLELPRDAIQTVIAQGQDAQGFWTPTKVGALIGLGVGAAIGFGAGDDGVFDDFTGAFSAAVLGGIGAAGGALTGYAVKKSRSRDVVVYVSS